MKDKIEIELDPNEKDLLLKFQGYIIDSDIIQIISNAKKRKNGYYYISFSHYEIDDLVGNLSSIINHEDGGKDDIIEHYCPVISQIITTVYVNRPLESCLSVQKTGFSALFSRKALRSKLGEFRTYWF